MGKLGMRKMAMAGDIQVMPTHVSAGVDLLVKAGFGYQRHFTFCDWVDLFNRVLNINKTKVSGSDVEQLVLCCPLLEFIGLGYCPDEVDLSLGHVAELWHLRAVDLRASCTLAHGACVGLHQLLKQPRLSAILLTEQQYELRAFIALWCPGVDIHVNGDANEEQFVNAYW